MANVNSSRVFKKSNSENSKIVREVVLKTKRSVDCSSESKKRWVLCNITNDGNLPKQAKVVKLSSSDAKAAGKDKVLKKSTIKSEILENISTISETSYKDSVIICDELQKTIPCDVEDFDRLNSKDHCAESGYAAHIFSYYRKREDKFKITKYLDYQKQITRTMRAILVDWMVDVQENFELNHETLYLAVKLVDMFLMKHLTAKTDLQLVGATAILIASKYDERMPPLVDDFLYICDDSYSRAELLKMEIKLLTCIKMDLGIPLSYRFLRRYARCSRISMETLTLARYILETCLMDYELIDVKDSKMAAAALLLALKMKNTKWTSTCEYYSEYEEKELMSLVQLMNKNIAAPLNKNTKAIRVKYSHEVFYKVSSVPPLVFKN